MTTPSRPGVFTLAARLSLLLAWSLWLALAPATASARPEDKTFLAALQQTRVGENGLRTLGFRRLLRDMELPQDADALERAVLYRYVDQLNGAAPDPDLTLGRLIESGRSRPAPDEAWVARWQDGFARSVAFEWPDATLPVPGELTPYLRDREQLGPGTWRVRFSTPRLYVAVTLLNRSAQPLPMPDLAMVLPGGTRALRFDCKFDRPRTTPANTTVLTLPAGDRAAMLCARDLPELEAQEVLDRVAAMRSSGPAPVLQLPPEARGSVRLLQDWARSAGGSLPSAWEHTMRVSKQDPRMGWRAAATPLDEPVALPSVAQRLKDKGKALVPFLAGSMAAMIIFVLGRMLQRVGIPLPLVVIATLVVSVIATGFIASSAAGPNPTAGEGWQRGATMGFIAAMGAGGVLLMALMLHVLHKRLDEDEISWLDAVISGWRHAFQLRGTASSGEFWGFMAHGLWLLVGVNIALRPWHAPVGALILVAMATMAWRRFSAFRLSEQIAMVVLVVLYVVSLVQGW